MSNGKTEFKNIENKITYEYCSSVKSYGRGPQVRERDTGETHEEINTGSKTRDTDNMLNRFQNKTGNSGSSGAPCGLFIECN